MVDYMKLTIDSGVLASENSSGTREQMINMITNYVPDTYNWFLFITGELMIMAATLKIMIQTNRK